MKFELIGKRFDNLMSKMQEQFDSVRSVFEKSMPNFEIEVTSKTELVEENDKFLLKISANGFKKKNIKVKIKGNTVIVNMFKEEKSDGGGTMSSASYVEETIPQGVNKLLATISLKDETLIVTLPKEKTE